MNYKIYKLTAVALVLSALLIGCARKKSMSPAENKDTMETAIKDTLKAGVPPYNKFIVFNNTKNKLILRVSKEKGTFDTIIPPKKVMGIKKGMKYEIAETENGELNGKYHEIIRNKSKIALTPKDSATVTFLIPKTLIGSVLDNNSAKINRPGAGGYTANTLAQYLPGVEIDSPQLDSVNSFTVCNDTYLDINNINVVENNPSAGGQTTTNIPRVAGSSSYSVSFNLAAEVSYVTVMGKDASGNLVPYEIRTSGAQINLEDGNPAWTIFYLSTDSSGFPAVILVIYRLDSTVQ